MAAWKHDGKAYGPGMQCSDLVIAASKAAGLSVDDTPLGGKTVTATWFSNGMGPDFAQILGGDDGIMLSEVAIEDGLNNIVIPIGSVIVADGHAALYAGGIMVNGNWEIITYDASDADNWTVSVTEGTASPSGQVDGMEFRGHKAGEHVTRLQWGKTRRVKIFVPVGAGNSPPQVRRDIQRRIIKK